MISISSRSGGRPESTSAHMITSSRLALRNWIGERLIATLTAPASWPRLARRLQDPFSERRDQAGLLGERDEPVGSDQALIGMVPADQRLHAAELPGDDVDHAAGSGARIHRATAARRSSSSWWRWSATAAICASKNEYPLRPAALIVEREIGLLHQLVGLDPVVRGHGDADAGADHDHARRCRTAC